MFSNTAVIFFLYFQRIWLFVFAFTEDELVTSDAITIMKSTLKPYEAGLIKYRNDFGEYYYEDGDDENEENDDDEEDYLDSVKDSFISGLRLDDDRKVQIEDLTICARFAFRYLGNFLSRSTLFMISEWKESADDIAQDFAMLVFGAYYPYTFFQFGNPVAKGSWNSYLLKKLGSEKLSLWGSQVWNHVCLSYEKKTSHIRVVFNGALSTVDYHDPELVNLTIPEDFLSKIYILRCAYNYTPDCSSPKAKLTDFNVWDRALTRDEALDWTSCRTRAKGNLVNWGTAKFEAQNMESRNVSVDKVCSQPRPKHVGIFNTMTFQELTHLCDTFKGTVSVIKDDATKAELDSHASHYKEYCHGDIYKSPKYWTGWTDENNENVFYDPNTGETFDEAASLSASPWELGEPNGERLENCASANLITGKWVDQRCSHRNCGFCYADISTEMRIRGLCQDSVFDKAYIIMGTRDGQPLFRGLTKSTLAYNFEDDSWKITNYDDLTVSATLFRNNVFVGIRRWEVKNDVGCFEFNETKTINLSLHFCNDEEFNCDSGECIPMEQRCDGRAQCWDTSDEFNCRFVEIKEDTYLKSIAPKSPGSDEENREPLKVDLKLIVTKILKITEVESKISMKLQLTLSWIDERLMFVNLRGEVGNGSEENMLSKRMQDKIWLPNLIFVNTDKQEMTIHDGKSIAFVMKEGPKSISRVRLKNTYLYYGYENPLVIRRMYAMDFLCDFNMAAFPFDTQKCEIVVIPTADIHEKVRLVVDKFGYSDQPELMQYYVKSVNMTGEVRLSGLNAAVMTISFSRKILEPLLTTYLPTALICIVSFSTNYFNSAYFEAAVTVNLTSLLLLTTVYISISESLPKTAYIKMIDVWMIFNLCIPFAEVLLHTVIDSYKHKNNNKVSNDSEEKNTIFEVRKTKSTGRKLKMWQKVATLGLPVVYIVFLIFYFMYGASL